MVSILRDKNANITGSKKYKLQYGEELINLEFISFHVMLYNILL